MNKKDVLGASAAAGNVQKNEKCTPTLSSAGNAYFPALIPSNLLGIFGADSIHSILLGYSIRRIIPSALLGYLI